MLKRLAIIAVLLASLGDAPPIPGQIANNPAGSGGDVQKQQGNGESNGKSALAPLPQNGAQPSSDDAEKPNAENTGNPVAISKLPTVSIGKDWADWSYWGFGGILVVVGSLQVWFLYGTLKGIQTQAGYMERQTKILEDSVAAAKTSARAANDQIEMMKQKEQARIQTIPLDFDAVDPSEPSKIMIEFVNVGPTNAFDVRVEAGAKVTVEGFKPEQGEYTDLALPALFKPDRTESSWVVFDFPRRWQNEVIDDRVRITLEVMGQVKYRDVFDAVHTDDFAYRMNVYGIERLPRDFIGLKLMRKWHPFDLHPGDLEF